MNRLDKIIGYFAPTRAAARFQARQQLEAQKRFYDAARPGRAVGNWQPPRTSAASETYLALEWLRAKARDLTRNNPHAAKAVEVLADNLVGPGIVPKADTGNATLNAKIDDLAKVVLKQIDADNVHDFYGMQRVGARTFFDGGEAVLRRRIRRKRDKLRLPLQFQLLEGDFIDNRKNGVLPDGGWITQGIEFDAIGRRRNYWMFKAHPGDTYMAALEGAFQCKPVPAEDITLIFEAQRAGQVRGVPWGTPVIVRTRMFDDYEDAERRRKQMESSLTTIVKGSILNADASDPTMTSLTPTVTDCDGRILESVEPGSIAYLRDTLEVQFPKPADAMGFTPYKRAELQSIAAGFRVPYEMISGDMSQNNFTSLRTGLLEFRGMIESLRKTIFIPMFCEPIWRAMIDMAILMGELPDDPSTYGVQWHPPEWAPIDPLNEENAWQVALRTGRKTLKQAVSATGRDFDEHIGEIAMINKLLDKKKIILDSDPRHTDKRGVEQQDASEAKGAAGLPTETPPPT